LFSDLYLLTRKGKQVSNWFDRVGKVLVKKNMNDSTRKGDHDMEKHIFQVCLLGERNGSRTAIA
jgi:hypothetical protein